MRLEFYSKKRAYRRYDGDVTIRAFDNNKRKGIGIIFKNKAKERITGTGYLSIATAENRLYFAEMDKETGYKASNNGEYTFRTNIIDTGLYIWAKEYAGTYQLEYDEELKLYYVNTRR